uniref:Ubiquitin-like domain-containing protein n=1 Tax=Oryza glumipatula TaxID=40148 RepID=A0A0D9Y902_9ORYZ
MDVTFQMWAGGALLGAKKGRSFTAEIGSTSSLQRMKTTVMNQEGIPVVHQRLFFGGVELQEKGDDTTREYSIVKGSTIDLLIPYRYRGAAADR